MEQHWLVVLISQATSLLYVNNSHLNLVPDVQLGKDPLCETNIKLIDDLIRGGIKKITCSCSM